MVLIGTGYRVSARGDLRQHGCVMSLHQTLLVGVWGGGGK